MCRSEGYPFLTVSTAVEALSHKAARPLTFSLGGGSKMFNKAASKLEDARANFDSLTSAGDTIQFRSAFTSFLSNCRAVTFALQKEGAHVEGFKDWYELKRGEMKADELMYFIHESRIEDFHGQGDAGKKVTCHRRRVMRYEEACQGYPV